MKRTDVEAEGVARVKGRGGGARPMWGLVVPAEILGLSPESSKNR